LLTPETLWAARSQKNIFSQILTRFPKYQWGCLLAWILTRSVWSAWSSGKVAVVRPQSLGRSLIAQRNQIEDSAAALVKDLPDYQRLTSVPGNGPINALTILAEAGELRRFAHHRQFLTFCEMDRAMIQSGTFHGRTKRSKYANARLRRTLWMAGQVAIAQCANSFRDTFERSIAKDRHNKHLRRKAYSPIAAKMARTVSGIIKHGEPDLPLL